MEMEMESAAQMMTVRVGRLSVVSLVTAGALPGDDIGQNKEKHGG